MNGEGFFYTSWTKGWKFLLTISTLVHLENQSILFETSARFSARFLAGIEESFTDDDPVEFVCITATQQ